MGGVDNVMTDLYEALLHLRYPGTEFSTILVTSDDVKQSIFSKENRGFLLSWLLKQNPALPSNKVPEYTDEKKLVEWYTNIGICTNADALLGQIPISKQISTLKNLLLFINNVLLAEKIDSDVEEEPIALDVLKKQLDKKINIIPSSCRLTTEMNYEETKQYLKNPNNSLSGKQTPISRRKSECSNEVCGSDGNIITSNQGSDLEMTVNKFVGAFDSMADELKTKNAVANSAALMDIYIDNMHSNMTILKESLRSRDEISNFQIKDAEKYETPLNETIENLVIQIEEVINLQKIE